MRLGAQPPCACDLTKVGATLHQEPAKDQFKTESPIRAFTTWDTMGKFAIGKGFRPSLQHLVPYLNAMEEKEGWSIVQILEADQQTPSFLFRQSRELTVFEVTNGLAPELAEEVTRLLDKSPLIDTAKLMPGRVHEVTSVFVDGTAFFGSDKPKLNQSSHVDDPINPKHYAGRACADLGERMTANSYQVLKYCWRLGEKDAECQELGKAIWYLDSEIELFSALDDEDEPRRSGVYPDHKWVNLKLKGQNQFVRDVALKLVSWNRYGNMNTLKLLRRVIDAEIVNRKCGEFGRQQEP